MDLSVIKEAADRYFPYYLSQKGINVERRFRCLNPDHVDNTPSMAYSKEISKCHCFSCGTTCDLFDVIKWDYNTSDFKETLNIACDLLGIREDDKKTEKKKIQKRIEKPVRRNSLISVEIRDKVYRTMRDLCPLTDADIVYLRETRGIPEQRARENYFRMVPGEGRAAVVRKISKLTGYGKETLKKVPGFFIQDGALDYADESGIGILIRDMNGKFTGVQIRRDTTDKGARYCWFSSKFAEGKQGFDGGASPGSQKDVLIPKDHKKMVCITEGRFKAEILYSHRNPVISVQGVSSWRGIEEMLRTFSEKSGTQTVCMMFDADLMGNYQVMQNLEKMSKAIKEKLPELKLVSAIWPIRYGKGIDDCILAGHMDKIRYVDAISMLETCSGTYKELAKKKVPRDQMKDLLQRMNEEIFFGKPKAA